MAYVRAACVHPCLRTYLGEANPEKVDRVKKSGDLDTKCEESRSVHKHVVDEVEHAHGSIDLGGELTNHNDKEDEGNTVGDENVTDGAVKVEHAATFNSTSDDRNHEHNQDDVELTPDNISLQIVTLVREDGVLVSPRVTLRVQRFVNRLETNEATCKHW